MASSAQSKISRFFASKSNTQHLKPADGNEHRSKRARREISSTTGVQTRFSQTVAVPSLQCNPSAMNAPSQRPFSLSIADVAAQLGYDSLTPLEQQVVQLKSSNPDSLLLVEVGHKYVSFGEDALELAATLDVEAFERNHMMVAGFPTHRLHVHIQRLLHRGLRVAVVNQCETAAEKAHARRARTELNNRPLGDGADEESSRLFMREVIAVFTMATFVEERVRSMVEASGVEPHSATPMLQSGRAALLLCIYEESCSSSTHPFVSGRVAERASAPASSRGGVVLSLVVIDVRCGQVSVEQLREAVDGRAQLGSRLEAWLPIELLIPDSSRLSAQTRRTLEQYRESYRMLGGTLRLRVEHAPAERFCAEEAIRWLHCSEDLGDAAASLSSQRHDVFTPSRAHLGGFVSSEDDHHRLTSLLQLPDGLLRCVGALCAPLAAAGQLSLLRSPSSFIASLRSPCMQLGSCALRDLHVLSPARRSLIDLIGPTLTPFGLRTLRCWVSRPLTDSAAIRERHHAVAELLALRLPSSALEPARVAGLRDTRRSSRPGLHSVVRAMRGCVDLEVGLARVSAGQSRVVQLCHCLLALCRIADATPASLLVDTASASHAAASSAGQQSSDGGRGGVGGVEWDAEEIPKSALLRRLLTVDRDLLTDVRQWALLLERAGSEGTPLSDLFGDESGATLPGGVDTRAVSSARRAVEALLLQLEREQLALVRRTLEWEDARFCHSPRMRDEYYVEVPHQMVQRVPAEWIRVGQTMAAVRFRPAEVERLLERLALLRERLAVAAQKAWAQLQACVAKRVPQLREWVHRLSQLDCLLAFAALASTDGYCKPTILNGSEPTSLSIEAGRHPLLEAFASDRQAVIPNDVRLGFCSGRDHTLDDGEDAGASGGEWSGDKHLPHCLVVTGPNSGGKSVYLRQVGLIVLMAQLGSFVPAKSCTITPLLQLHTRMGASDLICRSISTFAAELGPVSEALSTACPRSLLLLDELGRGTSTHDGIAIAHATLAHIASVIGSLCLFTTHYPAVAELAEKLPQNVALSHMATWQPESGVTLDRPCTSLASSLLHIQPLYRLEPGPGSGSYGMRVGAIVGLPAALLDSASWHSNELHERTVHQQQLREALRLAVNIIRATNESSPVDCNHATHDVPLRTVMLQLQVQATRALGNP